MNYKSPVNCPVCKNILEVTKLKCPICSTEINGRYVTCNYCALNERLALFLETFLKCRGNIKDVERSLSISYPTVKGLLDELLETLFPVQKADESGSGKAARQAADKAADKATDKAADILDKLESGNISVSEAAKLLDEVNR